MFQTFERTLRRCLIRCVYIVQGYDINSVSDSTDYDEDEWSSMVCALLAKFSTICLTTTRKTPWRMSQNRKFRQRARLQAVDTVISNLNTSLSNAGLQCKALSRAIDETIPEGQMAVKDKYTLFSRSASGYRKGVHKVPKFTKVPLPREGPRGF